MALSGSASAPTASVFEHKGDVMQDALMRVLIYQEAGIRQAPDAASSDLFCVTR